MAEVKRVCQQAAMISGYSIRNKVRVIMENFGLSSFKVRKAWELGSLLWWAANYSVAIARFVQRHVYRAGKHFDRSSSGEPLRCGDGQCHRSGSIRVTVDGHCARNSPGQFPGHRFNLAPLSLSRAIYPQSHNNIEPRTFRFSVNIGIFTRWRFRHLAS